MELKTRTLTMLALASIGMPTGAVGFPLLAGLSGCGEGLFNSEGAFERGEPLVVREEIAQAGGELQLQTATVSIPPNALDGAFIFTLERVPRAGTGGDGGATDDRPELGSIGPVFRLTGPGAMFAQGPEFWPRVQLQFAVPAGIDPGRVGLAQYIPEGPSANATIWNWVPLKAPDYQPDRGEFSGGIDATFRVAGGVKLAPVITCPSDRNSDCATNRCYAKVCQ